MATRKKNTKRGKKPWRNLFQRQAAVDVAERTDHANERSAAVAAYDRMIVAPAKVMVREILKGRTKPNRKQIAEAAELGDALARAQGMRPLKPPPYVSAGDTRTSGAKVLAREIRLGHYDP